MNKKYPLAYPAVNLHADPLTLKYFFRNACSWYCYSHISISREDLSEFIIVLEPQKSSSSDAACLVGPGCPMPPAAGRSGLPSPFAVQSSFKTQFWLFTELACFSFSLECHKWGETGLAAHCGDPATKLMRERKQFIAPNKCYSSKYQAATTLFIPLTTPFRSYAT